MRVIRQYTCSSGSTSLFPEILRWVDSSFDFFERMEDYIHVEVRKLYPEAELPSFGCDTSEPGCLRLTYRSTRPFAALAEGLIRGCVDSFRRGRRYRGRGSLGRGGDGRTVPHHPARCPAVSEIEQLERRLERERRARKAAEAIAEEKTREIYDDERPAAAAQQPSGGARAAAHRPNSPQRATRRYGQARRSRTSSPT